MKKLFTLILLLSTFCLSAQIGKTYHVTSQSLNLRSEPSTSAEKIDKLKKYDNVLILNDSISTGWYEVQFNGADGYVSNKYLKKGKCVVSYYSVRVGAVCRDGSSSSATGRGACSHHGGVAYWKTKEKRTINIIDK